MNLRPYQEQAVEASMTALSMRGRSTVLMAVGSGRTAVLSEVVARLRRNHVDLVLVLASSVVTTMQLGSRLGEWLHEDEITIGSGAARNATLPKRGIIVATVTWALARIPEFPKDAVLLLDDVNPSMKSVSTLVQHFSGGCLLFTSRSIADSSWEAVYQLDEQWLTQAGYLPNSRASTEGSASERVEVESSQDLERSRPGEGGRRRGIGNMWDTAKGHAAWRALAAALVVVAVVWVAGSPDVATVGLAMVKRYRLVSVGVIVFVALYATQVGIRALRAKLAPLDSAAIAVHAGGWELDQSDAQDHARRWLDRNGGYWRKAEVVVSALPDETVRIARLHVNVDLGDPNAYILDMSPTDSDSLSTVVKRTSGGMDLRALRLETERESKRDLSERSLVSSGSRSSNGQWVFIRSPDQEILGDYVLTIEYCEKTPQPRARVTVRTRFKAPTRWRLGARYQDDQRVWDLHLSG